MSSENISREHFSHVFVNRTVNAMDWTNPKKRKNTEETSELKPNKRPKTNSETVTNVLDTAPEPQASPDIALDSQPVEDVKMAENDRDEEEDGADGEGEEQEAMKEESSDGEQDVKEKKKREKESKESEEVESSEESEQIPEEERTSTKKGKYTLAEERRLMEGVRHVLSELFPDENIEDIFEQFASKKISTVKMGLWPKVGVLFLKNSKMVQLLIFCKVRTFLPGRTEDSVREHFFRTVGKKNG